MDAWTKTDAELVAAQLQRPARGAVGVGFRCPCSKPAVVVTEPRLPDGTPFPTTFYLSCPRATSACSTLESTGRMAEYTTALAADDELAAAYRGAHQAYLSDRAALGEVPEIANVSAGGMPDRVKCLHALAAHALAAGPGVNPIGDLVLAEIGDFWTTPCLSADSPNPNPNPNPREQA